MKIHSHSGYWVEVAPGGPWLGLGGSIVTTWSARGVWRTRAEALQVMARAPGRGGCRKAVSPSAECDNRRHVGGGSY
jgi:hypothetical protein